MPLSSEEVATEPARAVFSRVLLKLSGESLMGDKEYGLDGERIDSVAGEIIEVQQQGVELAIVVGAGNIYRGMAAAAEGMDRATADYAGMLATLLNALALQDALERRGAHTRVQSAIEVSEVAEGERHQQVPGTVLGDLPSKGALDEHADIVGSRAARR